MKELLLTLAVCYLIHLAFLSTMRIAERISVEMGGTQHRRSTIPGTHRRFLHFMDFACQKYGCHYGLPLVTFAFANLLVGDSITRQQWIVGLAIAVIDALVFTIMCLGRNHTPDSGYPEAGRISACGAIHSVYRGLNVGSIAICFLHIGELHWLFWVGGALYLITFGIDIRRGHFKSLD